MPPPLVRLAVRILRAAKVALVDDAWSSVSSFNLDLFSGKVNLESGVVSSSPALRAALSAQWDDDWAHSRRL